MAIGRYHTLIYQVRTMRNTNEMKVKKKITKTKTKQTNIQSSWSIHFRNGIREFFRENDERANIFHSHAETQRMVCECVYDFSSINK